MALHKLIKRALRYKTANVFSCRNKTSTGKKRYHRPECHIGMLVTHWDHNTHDRAQHSHTKLISAL